MTVTDLISHAYLCEQIKRHGCGYYGAYSDKWAPSVLALAATVSATSILDYGCGQGKLIEAIRAMHPELRVAGYDPAVPEFAALPRSADLVVCTDVLEHIEPDYLGPVLSHLASVTERWLMAVVATRPATWRLSNGQNGHLIIQRPAWWAKTLSDYGWRPRMMPVDLSSVYDPALEFAGLWEPPHGRAS